MLQAARAPTVGRMGHCTNLPGGRARCHPLLRVGLDATPDTCSWTVAARRHVAHTLRPPAFHGPPQPTPLTPGRFLALTFRRRIQLINVARGELVAPAPVSSGEAGAPIVGLAFSCDSSTLLSLTLSGEVCMHSVPGGEVVPGEEHGRKALKAALQQLGGGLQGVSAHPTLPSVFLLHSSTGVSRRVLVVGK